MEHLDTNALANHHLGSRIVVKAFRETVTFDQAHSIDGIRNLLVGVGDLF